MLDDKKIGIVIPCYKVKNHILTVLSKIESFVDKIYIVDDNCPENSGKFIMENFFFHGTIICQDVALGIKRAEIVT